MGAMQDVFLRESCCGLRHDPKRRMRVLVTGASGLLGRQIMNELPSEMWEVRGLYSSRAGKNLVQCDLTQVAQIAQQFAEFQPDVVIHSAAERRPDVVFKQPGIARTLNIDVTSNLAEACHKYNSWMIFLSTDYIFDGEEPPYATDAVPKPLSTYGEHKVAGEKICFEQCPTAAVLRVPLLYGPMEYAKESGVTAMYEELKKGVKKADHLQKRYPTFTCDVAKILRRMLEVHFDGIEPMSGIYHWQSNECFTKYDMIQLVATTVQMDGSEIEASLTKPKFPVPPDSRLDCSRLEAALDITGEAYRSPFRESLAFCMKSFLDAQPHEACQHENPIERTASGKEMHRGSVTHQEKDQFLEAFGANQSMALHDFARTHKGEIDAEALEHALVSQLHE